MTTARLRFRRGVLLPALLVIIAAVLGAAAGNRWRGGGPPVPARAAGEEAETVVSDLDRPEDDLFASVCEHSVPQYTCDECRYQLGMVKVAPALLAAGGLLDTTTIVAREIPATLDLDGEVQLDAGRSVRIRPRAGGVVRRILVDLGSRVAAGQPLLELDSADFAEDRAAWLQARTRRQLAQAAAEREADLHGRGICPRKDLLEAEAARDEAAAAEDAAAARLRGYGLTAPDLAAIGTEMARGNRLMVVAAPFAGTILEREVALGDLVDAGQPLLLLGDTSRLWVLANLREREIAALQDALTRASDGIAAEVSVLACPDRAFHGRLDQVGGTLDEATRTDRARVVVENPEGLLRPGMFAHVRLLLPGERRAAAVPADAVVEDGGRAFVFVASRPPYFVRRPVETGRSWDGWLEVRGGVTAGRTVVARGAFLLKSDVLRAKMGAGCAD